MSVGCVGCVVDLVYLASHLLDIFVRTSPSSVLCVWYYQPLLQYYLLSVMFYNLTCVRWQTHENLMCADDHDKGLRPLHIFPTLLCLAPPLPSPPHKLCQPHSLPSTMSRKRVQEHSASPKFHRVAWAEKRTRRGAVLTAEVITTPSSLKTPAKPKRHTTLHKVKDSQHQTPITSEGITAAMSLPPIPAPDILAPKRDRRGKVWRHISFLYTD